MRLHLKRMIRVATRVSVSTALTVGLATCARMTSQVDAMSRQAGDASPQAKNETPKTPPGKLGLVLNEPKALLGYTLIAAELKKSYLIDMEGRVVHKWEHDAGSHHGGYLLENGHLLRPAEYGPETRGFGGGPADLGRIQEYTWDGEVVWDFKFYNDKQLPHHDIAKLPNGNVLMVVWDKKTAQEAIAVGRKKELLSKYVLADSVVEIKPTGKTTGEVVWEWHLWDHLIQDHDSSKANYGKVADHPELVDINFVEDPMAPFDIKKDDQAKKADAAKKAALDVLKSIGYVGSPAATAQRVNPDWTHVNSVAYNAELDQIIVSVHECSEIWVIDHGTTKAESARHRGGRGGKGGDLLYRWGNPRVYRGGTAADRRLFAQHDAHWIPRGLPGEGHMLVFNNGANRPDGSYSSVDEIVPPIDEQGSYVKKEGVPFGPDRPVWSYTAPTKRDFFSPVISGAHRLPNGNTQICSGMNGTIFEVAPDKEMVWKYVNPAKGGRFGPGGPNRPNQVLPSFLQDGLQLSPEKRKELDAFQKQVDEKLVEILSTEQRKKLEHASGPGPGGFAGMPPPGRLISTTSLITLKTTPEQKEQLATLQKDIDAHLEKLFDADQKKKFAQLRKSFARGGPPGGGPGGPPGFHVPPGGEGLFRAYRYAKDHPGLAGKDLTPGETIEELEKRKLKRPPAVSPGVAQPMSEFQENRDGNLETPRTTPCDCPTGRVEWHR